MNAFPSIADILFLLGEKRKNLPGLVVLFLFLSALDLCGIGLIGPYIALVMDPELSFNPKIKELLQSVLTIPENPRTTILLLGAGLLIIFSLKAAMGVWIQKRILRFCWRHHQELRSHLFSAYQNIPYETLLQHNSSEFIQAYQHYSIQFTLTLTIILRLLSELIVVVVIALFLIKLNPTAFLLLSCLLAVTMATFDKFFKKRLTESGRLSNLNNIDAISSVRNAVYGLKEIRILGKESFFFDKANNASSKSSRFYAESHLLRQVPRYLLETTLVVFLVLVVSFFSIFGDSTIDLIPTLGILGVAALRLYPSANLITSGISQIRFSHHAIAVLANDLRAADPNKIDRRPEITKYEYQGTDSTFETLEFSDVSYSYPNAHRAALSGITLKITRGNAIAIFGPSGAGKSTLVDVLLNLLAPEEGQICLNGKPISSFEAVWHSMVSYIPQEPLLVEGSIRDNITLDSTNLEDMSSKIDDAIARAQLTEMIGDLKHGLETDIGENGMRLSGGQRQRLALARAFYHDRQVLIMDEATSALDVDTEKFIVYELSKKKNDVTMVIIAHRASTIKHCDWVYEIRSGNLINQGPPERILSTVAD